MALRLIGPGSTNDTVLEITDHREDRIGPANEGAERLAMKRREFNQGLLMALGLRTVGLSRPQSAPQIDEKRLIAHLNGLGEYGKNPQGGVSRVAYSDADLRGRRYVMDLMRTAKLETTIDPAGNIIGSRHGSAAGLRPIIMGSHIDSVPEG